MYWLCASPAWSWVPCLFLPNPPKLVLSCRVMGESVWGLGECGLVPKVEVWVPKILGSYRELCGISPHPKIFGFCCLFHFFFF